MTELSAGRATIISKVTSKQQVSTGSFADRADFYCALLVGLAISFNPIKNAFVLSVRSVFVPPYSLDTLLCYALFAYVLIRALPTLVRSFHWEETVPFLVLCAYCLLRSIIDNAGMSFGYYRSILIDFVVGAFPCYLVFRVCSTRKSVYRYVEIFAIVGMLSIALLLLRYANFTESVYSQYLAYETLPFALICASALFRRRTLPSKFVFLFCYLFGVFAIAAAGARGPLLVAVAYPLVRMISNRRGNIIRTLTMSICALIVVGIIVLNLEEAMSVFFSLLNDNGMSSRLLVKLNNGTLFVDMGRTGMAVHAWDLISASPIIGYGIGQDRSYLAGNIGDTTMVLGSYPHNIILELLLQYGLPIGVTLVILLTALIVLALRRSDGDNRELLTVLIFAGIFPLLFSGTYLDWPMLYALIGCCMSILRPLKQG